MSLDHQIRYPFHLFFPLSQQVHVYGSYKRPAPPSGSHTSTLVPNYNPAPDPRRSVPSDDDDEPPASSPLPGPPAPPITSQISRVYNQPDPRRRSQSTQKRVRPSKRNLTPQPKYDRQIQNEGDDDDNANEDDEEKTKVEEKPEIAVNNFQPPLPPNINYPAFPLHFPSNWLGFFVTF